MTRFPLGITSITLAVMTAVSSLLLDVEPAPSCFSLVSAPTDAWDSLSDGIPKNADMEVDRLESFSVLVEAFLFPFELSTMRTVTTSPTLPALKSLNRNDCGLSSDQRDPSLSAIAGLTPSPKMKTTSTRIYFIVTLLTN